MTINAASTSTNTALAINSDAVKLSSSVKSSSSTESTTELTKEEKIMTLMAMVY